MPGDGHVRCGGRPRETGRAESRHRGLGRSHNVKIRDGQVANRPIYVVLGVTADGERDVLGLWAGEHGDGEGAKFWLRVLAEIKNRGTADVLMVVCDGLKGLPDAIAQVWPQAITQTCSVHYADLGIMPTWLVKPLVAAA
jgi:hypothetical protein